VVFPFPLSITSKSACQAFTFGGVALVLHSLPELIAALEKYLFQHNKEPKPSIWTAQAKDILAKVTRARAKLNRRKRNAH
jgi:hypothetical protein